MSATQSPIANGDTIAAVPQKKRKTPCDAEESSKKKMTKVVDGKVYVRGDDNHWIELDATGCEIRSDDEDSDDDLDGFVVNENTESILSRERREAAEKAERNAHVDIDASNIISSSSKRTRKPVERYENSKEFKEQYLKLLQKDLEKERVENPSEDEESPPPLERSSKDGDDDTGVDVSVSADSVTVPEPDDYDPEEDPEEDDDTDDEEEPEAEDDDEYAPSGDEDECSESSEESGSDDGGD